MICPDCNGAKVKSFMVTDFEGYRRREWPCSRCKGTGEVFDDTPRWIELGAKLRAWRDSQDRSLREEAKRRGISPVLLSDMELGRCEPICPPEYEPKNLAIPTDKPVESSGRSGCANTLTGLTAADLTRR